MLVGSLIVLGLESLLGATLAAFGVYGTSAVTLVTAQNTLEVSQVEVLSASLVTAQIDAVARERDRSAK